MKPSLAPALRASPLVDFIEPRQWYHIQGVPGTSILAFLPLGTAQSIPWGIQLVRAPDAWSMTRGAGIKLFLIDTGMDTTHEDLPHPPADHCDGVFGGCDDGFPIPHGTHVMGIWTARDNTVGVEGVAPDVSSDLVYLWGACSSDTGGCSTTDIATALNASILDAGVINMSFGGPYDAGISAAVAQAWGRWKRRGRRGAGPQRSAGNGRLSRRLHQRDWRFWASAGQVIRQHQPMCSARPNAPQLELWTSRRYRGSVLGTEYSARWLRR